MWCHHTGGGQPASPRTTRERRVRPLARMIGSGHPTSAAASVPFGQCSARRPDGIERAPRAAIGWRSLTRRGSRRIRQRAKELAGGSDKEREPAFHEVIGQTRLQGHQTSVTSFGSCGVAGCKLSSGRRPGARNAYSFSRVDDAFYVSHEATQWCQGMSFEPPVLPRTHSAVRIRPPMACGPSRCPTLSSSRQLHPSTARDRLAVAKPSSAACLSSFRATTSREISHSWLVLACICNPRNAFAAIPASIFRAARMTGKDAKGTYPHRISSF